MSNIEKLKQDAIKLIKQYPDNISSSFLQKNLKIGVINTNKLVEWLDKKHIILSHIISNRNHDVYYKINKSNLN